MIEVKNYFRLKQEVETLQKEVLLSRKQPLKHNNELEIQAEVNELNESLNYDSISTNYESMQDVPKAISLIAVSNLTK